MGTRINADKGMLSERTKIGVRVKNRFATKAEKEAARLLRLTKHREFLARCRGEASK